MQVKINDQVVTIPSSLSEFTLGQRIAFQEQYGNALDETLKGILSMPAGSDREAELINFQFEKMFRTFAFFTGVHPDVLKESGHFIDEVAKIYYSCLQVLLEDESQLERSEEFYWKGELWSIQVPKLSFDSRIAIVKDLMALGKNKWQHLLPLCAMYLRKKGEAYQESLRYEGSDRIELMKSLPMDIAMAVGFFLSSTFNGLLNSPEFSSPGPVEKLKEPIHLVF